MRHTRVMAGIAFVLSPFATSFACAQTIGTGPLSSATLPAGGTVTLIASIVGLALIGYWALRRNKANWVAALAGPALLIGAGGTLLFSEQLRAVSFPDFSFSDPSGEVIDFSTAFNLGQLNFTVPNDSGVALKVVSITGPDPEDCPDIILDIGKPKLPARSEMPGDPVCDVGLVIPNGTACRINFFEGYCPENPFPSPPAT